MYHFNQIISCYFITIVPKCMYIQEMGLKSKTLCVSPTSQTKVLLLNSCVLYHLNPDIMVDKSYFSNFISTMMNFSAILNFVRNLLLLTSPKFLLNRTQSSAEIFSGVWMSIIIKNKVAKERKIQIVGGAYFTKMDITRKWEFHQSTHTVWVQWQ